MCDGFSWASWMMYSPRSVSMGVTPACSRASLRSISSVAMDFGLHRHLDAAVAAEPQHDLARLLAGAGPVHVPPQPLHVVGQQPEVVVEALQRGLLDAPRPIAEGLSWGKPSKASRRRSMNLVVAMPSASWR